MWRWSFFLLLGLAGCVEGEAAQTDAPEPTYLGVQTLLLDSDLVNLRVAMGEGSREEVDAYARCAAAQYTLIRGYGFARHIRTNIDRKGGVWRGDAVYTISASRPAGLRTIDAEAAVEECAAQGIPTI